MESNEPNKVGKNGYRYHKDSIKVIVSVSTSIAKPVKVRNLKD